MNFHRGSALGLALGALAFAQAHAQTFGSDEPYTGPDGLYLRGEGGLSLLNSEKGEGIAGSQLNFHSSEDAGYIAGGAAGFKIDQLRLELGLDYSGYDVSSIHVSNAGGLGPSLNGASSRPSGSVGVFDGMVNALWDFRTGTPFVPYVGLGVGAADVKLDNFSVAGKPLSNSSDMVFAYQPIVGVKFFVTDQVALGLEYRYFATVQPTFKDASGASFNGRVESHNILASLTYHFGSPPAPPAPPPPQPAVVMPPVAPLGLEQINPSAGPAKQTFIVYFDLNRASLTAQGMRIADAAAAAFKQTAATHIEIAGFTDASGGRAYDENLSRRRAETVRDYLVRQGVPLSEMAVSWHGKSNERVATPDGAREPQNRRVEINIP